MLSLWRAAFGPVACRAPLRCFVRPASGESVSQSAWRIVDYNGPEGLELADDLPLPPLQFPDQVLVEVKAASVNPLDLWMTEGYGRELFEKYTAFRSWGCSMHGGLARRHLPLVPGRDFAGVVRAVAGGGGCGGRALRPGAAVMGVVPPPHDGSHARYVVARAADVAAFRPDDDDGVSFQRAAAVPYAALTAWSALRCTAALCPDSVARQQVLVMGASGGVGSMAVQLLKIWGCSAVAATCADDAVDMVRRLGADVVVDYTSADAEAQLQQLGGFDVILDCTGRMEHQPEVHLLKPWSGGRYVTLTPPMLSNADRLGAAAGAVRTGLDLLAANGPALFTAGGSVRWAFFAPNAGALRAVAAHLDAGRLRPVVDAVYDFERLADAYVRLERGHVRGKIVVAVS